MKTYCDTSILVASSLQTHDFYQEGRYVHELVRKASLQGYISTHVIAELYSSLTRLPRPLQFSGPEARQLIVQDVLPYFEAVDLTHEDYMAAIDKSCETGRAGGAFYDVLHLAAARKSHCDVIFTFNVRHFRELAPDLATRIRAPQLP